jgi:hypothetical protein
VAEPDLTDYVQFVGCVFASKACRHVALACHHQECKKYLAKAKSDNSQLSPIPLPGLPKLEPFPLPLLPGVPVTILGLPVRLLASATSCQ